MAYRYRRPSSDPSLLFRWDTERKVGVWVDSVDITKVRYTSGFKWDSPTWTGRNIEVFPVSELDVPEGL